MKKILLSYIILTVILSGTVSAQTTTTSKIGIIQAITNIKQQVSEDKAKIKAEIASTTANIKNIKQDLKSSIEIRIGKKLDAQKLKIVNVFENSIQNLKDLISRIESRMTKMETSGINVSVSKTLLDSTKIKINISENELTNLANFLAQDIPSVSTSTTKNTERKTILQNIKIQSENTKSAIKLAHKSIINVVNSLKPGQFKVPKATSTQTISTSTNN